MSEAVSHADHHDDHDHKPTGIKRWLFSTNHKDIGTMYLVFALIMFFVGGAMAMVLSAKADANDGVRMELPKFASILRGLARAGSRTSSRFLRPR